MIREIVKDPMRLCHKAVVAGQTDLPLGWDLLETLNHHRETCVGLAANMIGVNKRVIVILMGDLPVVMFNPQVLSKAGPYETEEGCLSLTGLRKTLRYEEVTVTFRDLAWAQQTLTLTGFAAQICQHELDHLEGILI